MILVTNNEGTVGVPTTARMLADGAGAFRSVVLYLKRGATVADAVLEAVEDMRALKTGLINRVTIHAIDPCGNHKVVAVNGTGGNTYWLWDGRPRTAAGGGNSDTIRPISRAVSRATPRAIPTPQRRATVAQ